MRHLSPWAALAGGLILGLAAAFVLLHGGILGIRGIVGGLLHPRQGKNGRASPGAWPSCWAC